MAKNIKVIQCPKCGSTQNTEIKPDYFKCNNCGTEYFLDNDDVNINYNYRTPPPASTQPMQPGNKLRALIPLIVFGLAIIIYVISNVFSSSPSSPATSGNPIASAEGKYTWGSTTLHLLTSTQNKPVLMVAGIRTYTGRDKGEFYITFVDLEKGAELKGTVLEQASDAASINVGFKNMSNGDVYLVYNKSKVYQINRSTFTLTDVTSSIFRSQPALSSGIASIEFLDDDRGDGFSLFTNDGKNVFYFPLINKLYNSDNLYRAQNGFKSVLPNSTVKTAFIFSSKSLTYPEDKLQLIKYQYRDNVGGPKSAPLFQWDDDYGGSGIFTDADPHKKVLLYDSRKEDARVISFKDFTPGRLYFSPRLLAYNSANVLITFRPTAAPNAPALVQCMNANTGAIVFTKPLPDDSSSLDEGVACNGGFAWLSGQTAYTIDIKGNMKRAFKLD